MSEPAKAIKTRDPELAAMARVQRLLEELDEPARGRVMHWVMSRLYPQAILQLQPSAACKHPGFGPEKDGK